MEQLPGTTKLLIELPVRILDLLNLASEQGLITPLQYSHLCQQLADSDYDLQHLFNLWAQLAQLDSPDISAYLQKLT